MPWLVAERGQIHGLTRGCAGDELENSVLGALEETPVLETRMGICSDGLVVQCFPFLGYTPSCKRKMRIPTTELDNLKLPDGETTRRGWGREGGRTNGNRKLYTIAASTPHPTSFLSEGRVTELPHGYLSMTYFDVDMS